MIQVPYIWLRSIGKSGIERKIRKWISPSTNPSSGWISIKKSKSGFHGFPFYRSIGKIRKRICKTILVNSGLLYAYYACACVPRPAFVISNRVCLFQSCIVNMCLGSCIKLGVQFENEFILLALVMKIAGRLHLSD